MVSWRRLLAAGLTAAALCGLAGGALEWWRFGTTEAASAARVEAFVRRGFEAMSADLLQVASTVARNPDAAEYRRSLAQAHNWLGETLRLSVETREQAEAEYRRALELQRALVQADPENPEYAQDLARTHYNSAILHFESAEPGNDAFTEGEADLRESVRLLESLPPLEDEEARARARQDLGRAVNNLATLLALDDSRLVEAQFGRHVLLPVHIVGEVLITHKHQAGTGRQAAQAQMKLD